MRYENSKEVEGATVTGAAYIRMEQEADSEGSELSSEEDDIVGVTMDYTNDSLTSSSSDNEEFADSPAIVAGTSRSGRQTTRYKIR